MKSLKYWSILLFILSVSLTYSQSQEDDIKKINDKYSSFKNTYMEVEYYVYTNESSTIPIQQEKGIIKKMGELQYNKIGVVEIIKSTEYNFFINHEEKSMAVLPYKNASKESNAHPVVAVDKLLKLCKEFDFKNLDKAHKSCIMECPSSEFKKVIIEYSSKDYLISKVVLVYREALNLQGDNKGTKETPRIEIIYKNVKSNLSFSKETFTYDNYIEKRGGKLYCKQKYKGYKLYQ